MNERWFPVEASGFDSIVDWDNGVRQRAVVLELQEFDVAFGPALDLVLNGFKLQTWPDLFARIDHVTCMLHAGHRHRWRITLV